MLSDFKSRQGFTLVEILVVIALFSVFCVAIYSLYLTHMKTSITQEDVVDVQQNVRIAMESLTRDIMMAGFLVPPDSSGKTLYLDPTLTNYSSTIRLRTASSDAAFVRVASAATTTAVASFGPISVAPADALDKFKGGDAVRIIRTLNTTQPIDSVFSIITSNKALASTSLASAPNSATFPADIDYRAGDVICKVHSAGAPYPETVSYSVQPCLTGNVATTCLARSVNLGTAELIAQGISRVKFSYLLDDGTETSATSVMNNTDKLSTLRAVRVTITGQTSRVASPGDLPKTRQLTSIVKLRNRR